jgi:hypothetical protein
MGNGRAWSGKGSGKGWISVRIFAATVVLLVAGCVLVRTGSRRYSDQANAKFSVPASPVSTASVPTALRISQGAKPDARSLLGQLPLIFEPNQGQAAPRVKFLARGAGYTLLLNAARAELALQTAPGKRPGQNDESIRMTLVGADPSAVLAGTGALPGKTNYLFGNDPRKWRTGIPEFAGVRYESVYPGIDLAFYGNQGRLEYDFQVAPGADPSRAELQFDGAARVELKDGDLILAGKEGEGRVRLHAPRIYQRAGGQQQTVAGHFVLRAANRVGFDVGAYDRSRELVIDPLLEFSTYFGGTGAETSPSVAVNNDGFIYLVGTTQGSPANSFPDAATATQTLIPTSLALTTTSPNHIFVAKINPAAPSSVIYETFLGGSGSDTSIGVGVDLTGKVYVVGNTTSPDFPHSGLPYQTAPTAKGAQCASITCTSIFASVLSAGGAGLAYSTYLSGTGNDQATGMTIDTNSDVFITGTTTSTTTADAPSQTVDFPASYLPPPYQTVPRAAIQFFVTKINTNNVGTASIAYSTYFGGATPTSPVAVGGGIAVDTTGNIYFSGTTNFYNSGESQAGSGGGQVTDFPIVNAYQPCLDTIPPTTFNYPIACSSTGLPTPFPTDAFLAKLNPTNAQTGAAQLLFSTYLGGTSDDSSTGITIDSANIYLTGTTNSSDFVLPTGTGAFQECLNTPVNPTSGVCTTTGGGNTDAYVARFTNPTEGTGTGTGTTTPTPLTLGYFSYLGGSLDDAGLAIAVDTASGALVTGWTRSSDFPVTSPNTIQSKLNGTQNAFFAHIQTTTILGNNAVASFATYFGGNGVDQGTSITLDSSLNTYFAGDTTSNSLFQTDDPVQSQLNGPRDAFVVKLGTAADLCITCVPPVVSPAGSFVWAGNPVSITFTVTNNGPDLASNVIVSGTGAPYTSATAGSGTCSGPTNNSIACTIPALQSGATSQVVFTVTPTQAGGYAPAVSVSSINNNDPVPGNNTTTFPFTATTFAISVLPNGQTVSAGNTARYTVQITADPVYGGSIALTCGSAPVGAACNFGSSSITLNGTNSASTVLNLTTTARPVNSAGDVRGRHGPLYACWLMVPGMALLGFGSGTRRRRGWLLGGLSLMLLFALVVLQPACGKGKTPTTVSGTPAGNYSLTVTASSGSFNQSASFNLTVQ